MTRSLMILMFCLLTTSTAGQVVYVDSDATGQQDGSSWQDAYTDLRIALLFSPEGAEVRVAGGIYRPDSGTLQRSLSFALKDGQQLIGGYAGNGHPNPNERNYDVFWTRLTGDLLGDDQPDFVNRDDNSFHVLTNLPGATNFVVDGFVITSGNADGMGPQESLGGGALLNGDGAELRNCDLNWNRAAGSGGALHANIGLVENCSFSQNAAGTSGAGMWGRADLVMSSSFTDNIGDGAQVSGVGFRYAESGSRSSCVIAYCDFRSNAALHRGTGVGLYVSTTFESVAVSDCTFLDNRASGANSSGGGIAVFPFEGAATVERCEFRGNEVFGKGSRGGGSAAFSQYTLARFDSCVFNNNYAEGYGGAAYATWGIRFQNCTVVNNVTAQVDGAGIATSNASDEGTVDILQSILWGNVSASATPDFQDQLLWIMNGGLNDVPPDLDYSNVELYDGSYGGIGMLAADPLFVDSDGSDDVPGSNDDNFALMRTSPCIDAGDPTSPLDPDETIADLGAFFFDQGDPPPPPPPVWVDLGNSLSGLLGAPVLTANGSQEPGAPTAIALSDAFPLTLSYLVIGSMELSAPFKQGTMVPYPTLFSPRGTSSMGTVALSFPWPAAIPEGFQTWWQFWIQDPGGPAGWAASNAVLGTTPEG